MKVLVFEGNTAKTCQRIIHYGGMPYHQLFCRVIKKIDTTIDIDFAFPAQPGYRLLYPEHLQQYDAVLWTGSALTPYDTSPEVTQQIDQSKGVFESQVPYYGSCWGLQVAVMASGGQTALCPKGAEVGISENICLTQDGNNHPMTCTRVPDFHVFCLHYAEVSKIPDKATVLAYNAHSQVQALEIPYKGGVFFGVQYHPEFDLSTIKSAYRRNQQKFTTLNLYDGGKDTDTYVDKMLQQYPESSFTFDIHTQEIKNFLDFARKKAK